MKKSIFQKILFVIFFTFACAFTGIILYTHNFDRPVKTQTFLDRNGFVIGSLNTQSQGLQIWTSLENIPQDLVKKTIQQEDRYFYWHFGINPVAIIKTGFENLIQQRFRRGASTITQQLAKNLIQDKTQRVIPRSFFNKFREAILAYGLEMKHSKSWILERYLNSIYYGNRCYGIAAAAQLYFGKTLNQLNTEEKELLISLPKAPNRISSKLKLNSHNKDNKISATPASLGLINARHFLEYVATKSDETVVKTTLDLNLQKKIELALPSLLSHKILEDPKLNLGMIIIDVNTSDVLAMMGSRDYFEKQFGGQVNTAIAKRQPGSTLKPFTYYAAFTKNYRPHTIISDEPLGFSAPENKAVDPYMPQNFDRRFHGQTTIREALANSYNIPAVKMLNEIGTSYYYDTLMQFGFQSLSKPPNHYGLSLTLGSGEVTLLELTNAYASLARGGYFLPVRVLSSDPKPQRQAISAQPEFFAGEITKILSDPLARLKTFGFNEEMSVEGHSVAVKTGTSYELRDNWTIGYSPQYAVGVWVGHNDGTPLNNTTGATGAAPLWHAFMENLLRGHTPAQFSFLKEELNSNKAASLHPLVTNKVKQNFKITSPLPNIRFRYHVFLPKEHQKVMATAQVFTNNNFTLNWYLDDLFLETTHSQAPTIWIQPELGQHRLTAINEWGEEHSIHFQMIEGLDNRGLVFRN